MNDMYGVWNGEKLEFTLQKICDILDIQVPEYFQDRKDDVLEVLTYKDYFGRDKVNKDKSVIFDTEPDEDKREKYQEKYVGYIKEGVIIFTEDDLFDDEGNALPIVKLPNVWDQWNKLGKYVKKIFPMPTIGITGSVGKTTTTLFAENVFSEKYNVFVTGRNRNTSDEITRQMIMRFGPGFNMHIQESGGGHEKGIERSAEILDADAFGITKVSKHLHIDAYKSPEGILYDKTSFDRVSKDDAFGVVNIDDETLRDYSFKHEIITYGVENLNADYTAKDIRQENGKLHFTVVHGDDEYPITINIVGQHNVYNALMVIAFAEKFGLTKEEIQRGFLKYQSIEIRQNIREVSGRTLYIDCFNCCEDSILSCTETLHSLDVEKGKRKIAVLGGQAALVEHSYDVNYNTGAKLKPYDIDEFVFIGPKEPAEEWTYNTHGHGRAVYEGAIANALKDSNTTFVDDLSLLVKKLKTDTKPGDVILLKGNSKIPLFAAIDMAFGTSYLIKNPNFVKPRISENGFRGGYAKEIRGVNLMSGIVDGDTLNIPDTIKKRAVFRIARKVFADKPEIKHVNFGRRLKCIGNEAFINCTGIEELVIPANVIHIESEAFAGCTNLKKIVFEGVQHIEENAFRGCKGLKEVVFSTRSCKTIEKDAFADCGEFKVISPVSYIKRDGEGQVKANLKLNVWQRAVLKLQRAMKK